MCRENGVMHNLPDSDRADHLTERQPYIMLLSSTDLQGLVLQAKAVGCKPFAGLTIIAVQSIVWKLLDHIKSNPPQKGSFADLLLKAKDPKTGKPLSDELMFPEIAALFFAGIDTTGHTGTFIL